MNEIGHRRERDSGFYDWILTQPEWRCLITGVETSDLATVVRCHIRSKGAGGSDRWPMPLIAREHLKADTYPAWWYTNRVAVAEWCATLPELWDRYDNERAEKLMRS